MHWRCNAAGALFSHILVDAPMPHNFVYALGLAGFLVIPIQLCTCIDLLHWPESALISPRI